MCSISYTKSTLDDTKEACMCVLTEGSEPSKNVATNSCIVETSWQANSNSDQMWHEIRITMNELRTVVAIS